MIIKKYPINKEEMFRQYLFLFSFFIVIVIYMIRVKNNRNDGSLFHYAHFLCDCLFCEIMSDIFKYEEVIREKTIDQSIGNFSKIYTDVMMIKNTELFSEEFKNLPTDIIYYENKEKYCDKIHFDKFRNFIFSRYKINNLEYNNNYPQVILIKRNDRVNLIDDVYLAKINKNVSTGKERREIDNIDNVDSYLKDKYSDKFKSIYFENTPFEEQVLYFNNAKMIICAHGAVMSNMFFCKEGTTIIEVTCDTNWVFFNEISKILNLNHIKCGKNNFDEIIKCIKINEL